MHALRRQAVKFAKPLALALVCCSCNALARDPVRVEIVAAAMMGTPLVHVKVTNLTSSELRNVDVRLKVPLKGGKYIELKPSHLTSHSQGARITYVDSSLVARFPKLGPKSMAEVIVSFSEYRPAQILRPSNKDVVVTVNGG
jgi:hypothetical protein